MKCQICKTEEANALFQTKNVCQKCFRKLRNPIRSRRKRFK